MRSVLVLLALALSASVAAAQPGMTPPSTQPYGPQPSAPVYGPPAPMTPPQREAAPPPVKSESTARWAAVGTTALGVAMLYGAAENDSPELGVLSLGVMMVGPSMGHVYAGETGRALKMTLLRSSGLLIFAYGAAQESTYRCTDYCVEEGDAENAETLMLVGGAIVLGTAAYDIWDSANAARRTNAKRAAQWQVAPSVMSSQGRTMPAVALSATF